MKQINRDSADNLRWLLVLLILPVGGSANSRVSFISCRHVLQKSLIRRALLEHNIIFFCTGYYYWIMNKRSGDTQYISRVGRGSCSQVNRYRNPCHRFLDLQRDLWRLNQIPQLPGRAQTALCNPCRFSVGLLGFATGFSSPVVLRTEKHNRLHIESNLYCALSRRKQSVNYQQQETMTIITLIFKNNNRLHGAACLLRSRQSFSYSRISHTL